MISTAANSKCTRRGEEKALLAFTKNDSLQRERERERERVKCMVFEKYEYWALTLIYQDILFFRNLSSLNLCTCMSFPRNGQKNYQAT